MAQAPSESSKSDTKSSADETPPESYSDLVISTLPRRGGWAKPLVLYRNYWLNPGRLEHIIPVKERFKPRRDDIILATYPKCGTTWLKALAFTVTTRGRHALAGHPLLAGRHPHLEVPTPAGDLDGIERMPSPRLLATHLPLSLLPPVVAASGCRVVYLCRQPKDAFVSWWHFANQMRRKGSPPIKLDDALSMYCEGFSPFGPFWEHHLEYWKEKSARPEQVLFLKYEEIASDPVEVVRTLAGFFAVPFTEEEERRGVPEEVVRLCSFEMLSGLEHNKGGDVARGDSIVVGRSMFFRKGKVGDWENHMAKEMAEKLDDVVEDKLKGSGLVF
ncbi:flavonol 4-sulfotransferase [Panicum miliaceum]|uniref:Sulfotransferase n=1 Tax=Panicum miliaceum TaxID=4540 RepID=A0A3L6TK06_PANMI|nr:flavonol 4-sulfotransferase [Panicum miliaceum]